MENKQSVVQTIVKRDGSLVAFNQDMIEAAIHNASVEAGETVDVEVLAEKVVKRLKGGEVSVEDVQECVVHVLLASKHKHTGEAYIKHRTERNIVRERNSPMNKAIVSILERTDEKLLFENGNLDSETLTTQRTLLTGEVAKAYARNILPKEVVAAHDNGEVHHHDMNFNPMQPYTNCCLVALKGMLDKGFNLGGAQIGSPKSSGVATAVTAQIIAQVSSSQYGGTSIANIDQVLAPYVRMNKDKNRKLAEDWKIPDVEGFVEERTRKEVYDAFQALEYEVNSLFNSHSQSPFTTISFGMGTSWEEREIQKAILEVRLKGLGDNGITAIFPKLILFIEDGINLKPEDQNYDIKRLALKCSARRQYPDIISAKNNRDITGSSVPVTSMGCRSFLSVWKDKNGEEVLDGRNNLGVQSISIPMVALDSGGDFEKFWDILDKRCEIAHTGLLTRLKAFEGATSEIAPVLYKDGAFGVNMDRGEEISGLFKVGRSSLSLGYIGLAEAAYYMFDTDSVVTNKEAYKFTIEVAEFMKEKTEQWKKDEEYGYSLYSSPSEGYALRALEKCRARHGIVNNVTDKEYFTNSFHIDVREKIDPFTKIDLEAPFHWIANAGHITTAEFPDMKNNLDALEDVWDHAVDKTDYFSTNTGIDTCTCCNFVGEMQIAGDGFYTCPDCGNNDPEKMQVCRTISGYLGSIAQRPVNNGKAQEFTFRVKHM